jgi:hypothetical protein
MPEKNNFGEKEKQKSIRQTVSLHNLRPFFQTLEILWPIKPLAFPETGTKNMRVFPWRT